MHRFALLSLLCFFVIPLWTRAEIHTAVSISQKPQYLEFSVTIKNSEKTAQWFSLSSQAEILQLSHAQQEKAQDGLKKIKVEPLTEARLKYLIPYEADKSYFLSSPMEVWHPVNIPNNHYTDHKKKKNRSISSPHRTLVETFSIQTSLLPGFEWVHSATGVAQQELSYAFGRFKNYNSQDGRIRIYLAKTDDSLAKTLIEHLQNYLKHYENLYGEYSYDYFAVVESPDEIGYAFPKMTWIGTRLLRFPFILKTSLPHELLHSWWGNGVFVDYASGNWCEGLTAFGADYGLLGSEDKKLYRLKALTNYKSYANQDKEIPLSEFISRGEDRSLQAIGYDKSMMVFVMLEQILGERDFNKSLRGFYQRFKYRTASWQDIIDIMSQVSGHDLKAFKEYWVHSKGQLQNDFIQLALKTINQKPSIVAKVNPVELNKIRGMKVESTVQLATHQQNLDLLVSKNKPELESSNFTLSEKPLSYTLDPQFYLFRELNELETPVTFSKFFGATEALLRLDDQEWADSFQEVFDEKSWKRVDKIENLEKSQFLIISFRTASAHPLLRDALAKRKIQISTNSITLEGQSFLLQHHSVFVTIRVQNAFVTLIHLGEGPAPTRWLQRWSRYGAQGFVVLNSASASLQGIWLDPFEIPFSPMAQ